MTLSPSVCCGFTSSFNSFQVFLSPFLPENQQTILAYLFSCSVEVSFIFPPVFLLFFCFMLCLLFSVCHSLFSSYTCTILILFFLIVFLSCRRIDVSPSAFKKHSQLFEAMKSSEEGTYKVTEYFAVWSMLEKQTTAIQWASQMPLDCALLKPVAFLERRCSKSKKMQMQNMALWLCCLLYTTSTNGELVILWAQAWPGLMNQIKSEMEAAVPKLFKGL